MKIFALLFVTAGLLAEEPSWQSHFKSLALITVHAEPSASVRVTIHNSNSVPITAAMVSLRRFDAQGVARIKWEQFYDSDVTDTIAEPPIAPGMEATLDFGRQLIPNAPPDVVKPRVVIFEDGTFDGDPDYVQAVLRRRRAARDALGELLRLGDQMDRDQADLATELKAAQKFTDEKLKTAASYDERGALVTAVGSFAINIKQNYKGLPVFAKSARPIYASRKERLDNSKPALGTSGQ